jgi:hypothetical protein
MCSELSLYILARFATAPRQVRRDRSGAWTGCPAFVRDSSMDEGFVDEPPAPQQDRTNEEAAREDSYGQGSGAPQPGRVYPSSSHFWWSRRLAALG